MTNAVPIRQVPDSWWQSACERINHPLACVAEDDRFVWVNGAYERLVGYSMAELRQMTWQEITVDEDIGADQRNVQAILHGHDQSYTMGKRYRHKRGHVVPITLTVWKHHTDTNNIIFLIAEAMPEHVTSEELASIKESIKVEFKALQQRLAIIERRNVRNGHGQNINIGDRNSLDTVKWMVIALVALVTAVAYMSYVGTWRQHRGEAKPPSIEVPTP